MLDASELGQETATMAAQLRKTAFWYHSPPFAHRDRKIKRPFRKGAIGVRKFEARGATRCSEGVPFMSIAMHDISGVAAA